MQLFRPRSLRTLLCSTIFPALPLLFLSVLLGACGHTPVSRTLWDAMGKGQSVDAIILNPNLRYLRVSVRGRVVLMVLGYLDAAPDGVIETWYSSAGEVLRLPPTTGALSACYKHRRRAWPRRASFAFM